MGESVIFTVMLIEISTIFTPIIMWPIKIILVIDFAGFLFFFFSGLCSEGQGWERAAAHHMDPKVFPTEVSSVCLSCHDRCASVQYTIVHGQCVLFMLWGVHFCSSPRSAHYGTSYLCSSTMLRVGWLCHCPGIVWEPIWNGAHMQLFREHSATVISAC